MNLTRRTTFKAGAFGLIGAAGLALPAGRVLQAKSASQLAKANFPVPFQTPFVRPPVLTPVRTYQDTDGVPVQQYTVFEKVGLADIVPGLSTPIYGYNGILPGPTVDVEQGTRVVLRVRNQLPTIGGHHGGAWATSTHLHGQASLPEYDGYADDLTAPGQYKDYVYDNFQPARTLWYHDHGVHATAQSVYAGLAAMYRLHDPTERALLPQNEFDVPLVISDAMFAASGTAAFDDHNHSGLWGDIVLVNGKPWPTMRVQRRIYRFRVLNASISRSYRLALSTGEPVRVVATDGGLMPVARDVASWRHGPAERYEVLIDFSKYAPGTQVVLRNSSNKNNIDYKNTDKIMAFEVTDDAVDTTDPTAGTLPTILASSTAMSLTAGDAVRTRRLRLKHDDVTGLWTINDRTWADVVASGYQLNVADPALNDVEIWQVETSGGGWFHPLHIHLVDFQVLSRNGKPAFDWERGPKDVIYTGEHETIRLLMKFQHRRGRYMLHCHNLTHEDHDMMQQFTVGLRPGDPDPHDPIRAAPAKVDDLPVDA
jgi:spore coat protein A, manganese oxidase